MPARVRKAVLLLLLLPCIASCAAHQPGSTPPYGPPDRQAQPGESVGLGLLLFWLGLAIGAGGACAWRRAALRRGLRGEGGEAGGRGLAMAESALVLVEEILASLGGQSRRRWRNRATRGGEHGAED